ncbi:MAG TPA: hypothetical protein VMY34_00230, partial [Acidimicrobiales bacterium]|nr:hypothetical protein [Acidimicrobiales bacterium]
MVFAPPRRARTGRRFLQLFPGLLGCGVGLALMVEARLGLGPWEVLHQGLSERTGIGIGKCGVLVGLVVLLTWIPMRQRPGPGTICNVVLIGLTIDATIEALPTPDALASRVALFAAGLAILAVGSGLYIGAGLGAGPRDGLMTGLAARGHTIRSVRTVLEVSALALGWILGGQV